MQCIFDVPMNELKELGLDKDKSTVECIYKEIFEVAKKRAGKEVLTLEELVAGWYEIGYKKYGRHKKTKKAMIVESSLLSRTNTVRKKILCKVGRAKFKLDKEAVK